MTLHAPIRFSSLALVLLFISVAEAREGKPAAVAKLMNAQGKSIGKAEVFRAAKGIKIHVKVDGLEPGPRGMHIHETGKCEGPDFKSAGAHLSLESQQHGLEHDQPHAGDFPNLRVNEDGAADQVFETDRVTLGPASDARSLFKAGGTALVIHAKKDDQKTDPSGDSGARVACGVFRRR